MLAKGVHSVSPVSPLTCAHYASARVSRAIAWIYPRFMLALSLPPCNTLTHTCGGNACFRLQGLLRCDSSLLKRRMLLCSAILSPLGDSLPSASYPGILAYSPYQGCSQGWAWMPLISSPCLTQGMICISLWPHPLHPSHSSSMMSSIMRLWRSIQQRISIRRI